MNRIAHLFAEAEVNFKSQNSLMKTNNYLLAMTPRSGSSYLCDVMLHTNCFGKPNEFLNPDFLPVMLAKMQGSSPETYLLDIMQFQQSQNKVAGFKTSWNQFKDFLQVLHNKSVLNKFKYIYLTRKNRIAQAISLYKAAESKIFHTNKNHSASKLQQLENLKYNFQKIQHWEQHILQQEQGWQEYFATNKIQPLCITYEDIEANILQVLQDIAAYLDLDVQKIHVPTKKSVFNKISDQRNLEWAQKFKLERDG